MGQVRDLHSPCEKFILPTFLPALARGSIVFTFGTLQVLRDEKQVFQRGLYLAVRLKLRIGVGRRLRMIGFPEVLIRPGTGIGIFLSTKRRRFSVEVYWQISKIRR
jgi:hypothetical protein